MSVGAMAQGVGTVWNFQQELNQAEFMDETRKRLGYQRDLDIKALNKRMQAIVGDQTVAVANSGFKYGGSKAKAINDTIYQFKLREAEYLNTYKLQKKALRIDAKNKRTGAFIGLLGGAAKTYAMAKGTNQNTSQQTGGYNSTLGKTPQLGSTYQASGQLSGSFSILGHKSRSSNYGLRLRK
jgi:hypothetical protein